MVKNLAAKFMNKFNKPKIIPDKRNKLKEKEQMNDVELAIKNVKLWRAGKRKYPF